MKLKTFNCLALLCFMVGFFPLQKTYSFQEGELPPGKKNNVVFIFVDDLRPALGSYGDLVVKSPHLDEFAKQAALFTRQYVTVPTCGASRYSLLRSRLPRNQLELTNEAAKLLSDSLGLEPETFIEHLRRNGYHTIGIGKVSHSADGYVYPYAGPISSKPELPNSWDELLFNNGIWGSGWEAFFAYENGSSRLSEDGMVPPFEKGKTDDLGYPDGLTAKLAVEKIKDLKTAEKPFFLGVGFFKPHLPFNAPEKYWDLYHEGDIPLSLTPGISLNVDSGSLHESGEINQYRLIEHPVSLKHPLSESYSRKLIHGYYASISYVDAQIGKVMDALKEAGLYDNSLIVVWGDHGWHLGDQGVWGKHTLFDRSLRSVLLMKPAGDTTGRKIEHVVSSIDIAPTMLDLLGLAPMKSMDGKSMKQLLANQDQQQQGWKNAAYSYFNNGISVMTGRYRFTHYYDRNVVELFDHQQDPLERINLAADHPLLVEKLNKLLAAGNTGLYSSEENR